MGQRISRYKKKKVARKPLKKDQSLAQSSVVLIEEKNDTIKAIDFFGFSPKIYWQDLGRTGIATIVIVTVLIGIYLFTR